MAVTLGNTSITALKGVGPKMAEKLEAFGLRNVQDVLFHLPLRYEDRTRVYNVADCYHGLHGTIVGEVVSADIKYGRKRSLVVKVADSTGTLTCRFFYFAKAQVSQLVPGTAIRQRCE